MKDWFNLLVRPRVLIAAIAALTLFFNFQSFEPDRMLNAITLKTADTPEHLNPTDFLIEKGMYSINGNDPYAVRMPGYAFPYVLLRTFLEKDAARSALIVLQWLFWVLALVLSYSWLSKRVPPWYAFVAVVLLTVFNYMSHLHFSLLPVSLAMSVLLVLFYLHHQLSDDRNASAFKLLLFGALLTWLFFLRPFLLPLLLVWPPVLALNRGARRWRVLFLVVLPIVVIESAWIVRNYVAFDRFVPLQTTFVRQSFDDHYKTTSTKESVLPIRRFIAGFGGENVWYFKDSHMGWFLSVADDRQPKQVFPPNVFDAGITSDELTAFKHLIAQSYANYQPETEAEVAAKAKNLTQRLKANDPVAFYTTARLKMLMRMLKQNVSQDWPAGGFGQASLPGKAFRLACQLLWVLSFTAGLVLCVTLVLTPKSWHFATLIGGLVVMFTFSIEFMHFQYFVFSYLAAFVLLAVTIGRRLPMR